MHAGDLEPGGRQRYISIQEFINHVCESSTNRAKDLVLFISEVAARLELRFDMEAGREPGRNELHDAFPNTFIATT